MRLLPILLLFSAIIQPQAWGHGENRPGPNQGFIRMPGPFHTELVPLDEKQFKVFLLDINFKNPSINNSALEMTFVDDKKMVATCNSKDNYYLCLFSQKLSMNKGAKILVKSMREGQKGMEVVYDIPLKHQTSKTDHHSH